MTDEVDDGEDGAPASSDDVASAPSEVADFPEDIRRRFPSDLYTKYEFHSYRNGAAILYDIHRSEFEEIVLALREFTITTDIIRTAGGNEFEIPKTFSSVLRGRRWHETAVQGDLIVRLSWRQQEGETKRGKPIFVDRTREMIHAKYLDGHKIDYVKGRVAFDLEWNSKDQTFDRDLYAFRAFYDCRVIDTAVIVTRSAELDPVFRALGPSLDRDGQVETKRDGTPRLTREKYGASTTWMGKLLYRLNAGRNGGCPVLAVGIRPACISDWIAP